ncbi:hypothetical protein BASA60_008837 [Batrachochytrium salamandrivorans]|nr:hypothetical protein BASA60_008837 [Batrachochytrium salamandrivorans]KAH6578067.1 hypothetical protein BASA62_000506 [Batrachochytrium salamandrivorans]KAH9271376.1 hypothetical protein BASA83_006467 [Batrachochytrium salamandrivorans]
MFKNEYQGGPSFEIFSSQGTAASLLQWKINNKRSITKFDPMSPEEQGFCHICEGLGRLSFPKDERQKAYLIQPFLVMQLYVPNGQPFSIELSVSDLNGNQRRFFLSTAHKEIKSTALHCGIPLGAIKRGVWLNICLDMASLVSDNYHGQSFRSLDSIALLGIFRLRRIFTLLKQLPDTTGEEYEEPKRILLYNIEYLPRALDFPVGVSYINQVLNMHRISYSAIGAQMDTKESRQAHNAVVATMSVRSLPNVAFGKHTDIQVPPLGKSKSRATLTPIKPIGSCALKKKKPTDSSCNSLAETTDLRSSAGLVRSTPDRAYSRSSEVSSSNDSLLKDKKTFAISRIESNSSSSREGLPFKLPPIKDTDKRKPKISGIIQPLDRESKTKVSSTPIPVFDDLHTSWMDSSSGMDTGRELNQYNPELYTDDCDEFSGWVQNSPVESGDSATFSSINSNKTAQVSDLGRTPTPNELLQKTINAVLSNRSGVNSPSTTLHDETCITNDSYMKKIYNMHIEYKDGPSISLVCPSILDKETAVGIVGQNIKRSDTFSLMDVLPEIKGTGNVDTDDDAKQIINPTKLDTISHTLNTDSKDSHISKLNSKMVSTSPNLDNDFRKGPLSKIQKRSQLPILVASHNRSSSFGILDPSYKELQSSIVSKPLTPLKPISFSGTPDYLLNPSFTQVTTNGSLGMNCFDLEPPLILPINTPVVPNTSYSVHSKSGSPTTRHSRDNSKPDSVYSNISIKSDNSPQSYHSIKGTHDIQSPALSIVDPLISEIRSRTSSSKCLLSAAPAAEIPKLLKDAQSPEMALASHLTDTLALNLSTDLVSGNSYDIESHFTEIYSKNQEACDIQIKPEQKPLNYYELSKQVPLLQPAYVYSTLPDDPHNFIEPPTQSSIEPGQLDAAAFNSKNEHSPKRDTDSTEPHSSSSKGVYLDKSGELSSDIDVSDSEMDIALDTLTIFDEYGAQQKLILQSETHENVESVLANASRPIERPDEDFNVSTDDADETLELEFDSELNCYRDPLTGKCYDIDP